MRQLSVQPLMRIWLQKPDAGARIEKIRGQYGVGEACRQQKVEAAANDLTAITGQHR